MCHKPLGHINMIFFSFPCCDGFKKTNKNNLSNFFLTQILFKNDVAIHECIPTLPLCSVWLQTCNIFFQLFIVKKPFEVIIRNTKKKNAHNSNNHLTLF